MTAPSCRTCGAADCHWVGKLPDAQWFAGKSIENKLPGGDLWRCLSCRFLFRSPLLAEGTYETLYRNGGLDVWDVEADREDFRLIREMLEPFEGQELKVLDFGCYTGQLLVSLASSFRKFGIEPNRQAASIAADRGIQVVAATLDEIVGPSVKYDVILCCDVIEHVANPLELMTRLRAQLKEGGLLIVSTGNSDALLWRLTGSRFWYCQHAEHISFVGRRWIHRLQRQAGFEIQSVKRFNYRGGTIDPGRALAALLFRMSPTTYRLLRKSFGSAKHPDGVPGNGATMDHILCQFKAI
jgi:SAM-dependent methyltransferase